jgi:ribose-phosphate pyrophosphokinase
MDLHSPQVQGFFNLPMDHLRGVITFANYYKKCFPDLSDFVAVSPDLGSVARVRQFAEMMNVPLAIVDKRRPRDNVSEVMNFIGEVEGKNAILLDDVVTTGGTLVNAADAILEHGAKAVYAGISHPVLCGDAFKLINESRLEELVVLNTIEVPEEGRPEKLKVLDISHVFADAIKYIHLGRSISKLFEFNNNEWKSGG